MSFRKRRKTTERLDIRRWWSWPSSSTLGCWSYHRNSNRKKSKASCRTGGQTWACLACAGRQRVKSSVSRLHNCCPWGSLKRGAGFQAVVCLRLAKTLIGLSKGL
jgi:hypothetical protein